MRVVRLFGLFLLLIPSLVSAETAGGPDAEIYVDWETGHVVLESRLPVDGPLDPRARFRLVQDLDRAAPDVFMATIGDLVVDSWYTVGELVADRSDLISDLRILSMEATRETSRFTPDLSSVEASYSFPLFGQNGLMSSLVTHRRALELREILGPVPQIRATGLVIYAALPVPAYAKDNDATPVPALFPRIYDEEMNLVLERQMVDPNRLRDWGMVAYTEQMDERLHTPRIGVAPLRVLARGVFGSNNTDLIIPTETARRLLASEDGRRILAEGRILVVYASGRSDLE